MSNRFWRGLSVGLPISLALWVAIIGSVILLTGCAKEPPGRNLWRIVQQ